MKQQELKTWFSEPEAAAHLGISVRTLIRLRKAGNGPTAVRIGHQLRYERAALDAWARECAVR